ncbi:MAG: hypothetical protein V7731_09120 [Amphritea sp.]
MSFEIRNPATGELSEQFDFLTDAQNEQPLVIAERRCFVESKLTWDIFQHQERLLSEHSSKSSLDEAQQLDEPLQKDAQISVTGRNGKT